MKEQCTGEDWESKRFHWADYLVFGICMLVSVGFGVFHGFFTKRKNTTSELLMGNKQMNYLTLGLSLTIGFASSIALLGNVAEIYNFGTQFALSLAAAFIQIPFTLGLFLPVLRELGIFSVYEYFERRFGKDVRLLITVIYLLHTGGVKAAVGSDVFQLAGLTIGFLALLIQGSIMDGGPAVIWNAAYESDRLELFIMDPDPRVRHTFWSVLIGMSFYWVAMCAGQATFQRLLSLPTQREATKALTIASVTIFIVYALTFYYGLMVYARYQSCDPLLSKSIDASDQIFPLYLMDILGQFPGLPGLTVAGIFSASLGTLSMALSASSANILQDVLIGGFNYQPTERKAFVITQLLTIIIGIFSFALTFLVAMMGSIMQFTMTFNGVMIGITLAMFTLGMYVPYSNRRGILTGTVIGFLLVAWLATGAQVAILQGKLVYERKEVGTNCTCDINLPEIPPQDDVFNGYRLSYLWYTPLGWFITVATATVASLLWDKHSHQTLDPNLLASVVRKWYIKKYRSLSSEDLTTQKKNSVTTSINNG